MRSLKNFREFISEYEEFDMNWDSGEWQYEDAEEWNLPSDKVSFTTFKDNYEFYVNGNRNNRIYSNDYFSEYVSDYIAKKSNQMI